MPDQEETPLLKPSPQWWLYILRCSRGNSLYTGITTDVDARLAAHQAGKGAKYCRGRGSLKVVYRELVGTKSEATKREMAIKKLPRSEKNLLFARKSKAKCQVEGRPR